MSWIIAYKAVINETHNHLNQMTVELTIEWQFSHRIKTETNAEMESLSDLEHSTADGR